MRTILLLLTLVSAVTATADETRNLSHAKKAHVFVIADSAGPVYGYAELADVYQAWQSTETNWTKTIQGRSVAEVRSKLAKLMRDEVIPNPRPPKVTHNLFGPTIDWGEIDDDRKSIYNVSEWAPPAERRSWRRTWTLSASRD